MIVIFIERTTKILPVSTKEVQSYGVEDIVSRMYAGSWNIPFLSQHLYLEWLARIFL